MTADLELWLREVGPWRCLHPYINTYQDPRTNDTIYVCRGCGARARIDLQMAILSNRYGVVLEWKKAS